MNLRRALPFLSNFTTIESTQSDRKYNRGLRKQTRASQFSNFRQNRLQSRRDCALQPRVGELASLPWVGMRVSLNPERVPPLILHTCIIQNEHLANLETLPNQTYQVLSFEKTALTATTTVVVLPQ